MLDAQLARHLADREVAMGEAVTPENVSGARRKE